MAQSTFCDVAIDIAEIRGEYTRRDKEHERTDLGQKQIFHQATLWIIKISEIPIVPSFAFLH